MKFINPETKDIYEIDRDGKEWTCVKTNLENQSMDYVNDFKAQDEEGKALEKLIIYAQDKNLIPLFVHEIIENKDLTLQGTIDKHKMWKTVSSDRLIEILQEYVKCTEEIEILEGTMVDTVKSTRAKYNADIINLQKQQKKLMPMIEHEGELAEVDASWERYAKINVMVLIDRETNQAIKIRPMDHHETEPDVFDDAGPDLDDMAPDKEGGVDFKPPSVQQDVNIVDGTVEIPFEDNGE